VPLLRLPYFLQTGPSSAIETSARGRDIRPAAQAWRTGSISAQTATAVRSSFALSSRKQTERPSVSMRRKPVVMRSRWRASLGSNPKDPQVNEFRAPKSMLPASTD
jgi:hypothetical protein